MPHCGANRNSGVKHSRCLQMSETLEVLATPELSVESFNL